jgi:hypothetical protein
MPQRLKLLALQILVDFLHDIVLRHISLSIRPVAKVGFESLLTGA